MPDVDNLLPVDPDLAAQFGPGFIMEGATPEVEPEPESEPDPVVADLDDRAKDDFVGLLYLGHLEDECTVAGHRFLLRTPGQAERLEMGAIHASYLNTMATEPAWRIITVAAYLARIDSMLAAEPLSNNVGPVRTRFEWLQRSIASIVVVDLIYEECLLLAARERKVVDYLDRLGEPTA